VKTKYVVHPTTLDLFSTCKLKWKWSRTYKPRQVSPWLTFGEAIHLALEDYYSMESENFVEVFQKFMRANSVSIEGYDDLFELGTKMLINYKERYELSETLEVLALEQEIARRIPVPPDAEIIHQNLYVAARIDGLVRDRNLNKVFVLEHKTFEKFYPQTLDLNHQFALEKYVAEGFYHGEDGVSGVIYNGLRKADKVGKGANLFERVILYINEPQVSTALYRAYYTLLQMIDPKLKVYPEPDSLKCNFCGFKVPCAEYMRGGDYQFYLDSLYEFQEDKGQIWQ